MRLRIVHVLHSLGTGGLEKGVVTLVRHSSDRFEHIIVCLDKSGCLADQLPPGTKVVEMHKPPGNSFLFLRRLSTTLRSLQPALVHTRNWGGIDGIVASRMAGIKIVLHGEHGWDMADRDGNSPKRMLLRRLASRWTTEFTCVSKQIEAWLKDKVRISCPVSQIYNGVDASLYAPGGSKQQTRRRAGLPEEGFCIGIVSRLDPIKDHETLLRAFSHLNKLHRDLTLVIVGDGPEMARLVGLAEQGVVFLGNRRDVPQLLPALDVFVLPSLNEGVSNTILEAMASGLPVVASRVGGNVELVRDGVTGHLFEPGNDRELAAILSQYLADHRRGSLHGAAGREIATANHSVASMVSGYEMVWSRYVAGSTLINI